jgi:alpha-tubulin suppressor-like RCC1 family protein
MEKIKSSCVHHLLVLDEYLTSLWTIHYPREILQIIMIVYYKLFEVKIYIKENDFILLINNDVYNKPLNTPHATYSSNIILTNIDKISCSYNHTIALTKSDEIYVCGHNMNGELGLGDQTSRSYFCVQQWKEEGMIKKLTNIKKISTGYCHSMALTKSGEVYTWGCNSFSQLGRESDQKIPKKINLENIKKIATGDSHSMALTHTGIIYVWGWNYYGQFGIERPTTKPLLPTKSNLSNIKNIFCGWHYSMAITNSGEIYAWGKNKYGQLGLGHTNHVYVPEKVNFSNIKKISCGKNRTMALTNSGEVYEWGKSFWEFPCSVLPIKLNFSKAKEITCGKDMSIVITEMNEIYIWGKEYGYTPQKIEI